MLVASVAMLGCAQNAAAPQPVASPSTTPLPPPPPPACWDQPILQAGTTTGDVVTCRGNFRVEYPAIKAAGLAQAARYALLVRRTHVAILGENNFLGEGQRVPVQCQMRETERSKVARFLHGLGDRPSEETTETKCESWGSNSLDCKSTTKYPQPPEAPPPVKTETQCWGGDVVAGTEDHILQLSVSFLTTEEAALVPDALDANQLLGRRPTALQPALRSTSVPSLTP